jgi:hypothetical protein
VVATTAVVDEAEELEVVAAGTVAVGSAPGSGAQATIRARTSNVSHRMWERVRILTGGPSQNH